MNKQLPLKRIAVAGLGAVLLTAAASALADPPSRIARLAYIDGPVSFAPAGDNTWEYAAVNRPLIAGDRLWVEAGGRDEVQVGGAALRMGGNTLVTLLNIDDRTTQLQLSQGRLNVRVRNLRPNEVFEIDTPNLALSIRQPGDYRIDVDPVGNATMVAVPRGLAEAYGDGNAYRLGSGQAYVFGGTDLRDVRQTRADVNDDFDRWSASRDRRIEQARSVRYVSPDLVGYEDLDDQGTWSIVPSYGNVWMPAHVGRDWAPYRDGHWTYVQPWGWTWVDDAPWGFAVSHYGRWARFPQGWGWVPGPRAASPVYAPALVAFVSIGAGAYAQRERPVAWFPLAPREVYRPSYRASSNYITNINVTNTALGRNQIPREGHRVEYANRRVGGAVTAVPASAFVHAQPVSRSIVVLPMAALAGAAIAHMAPVAPERGTRGRGNPGHQPPQAVMARQVLAKNAPPPEFRQAPRPAANNAAPAPQMAGPAPRVLSQDRHGGGRQLREVPTQQPVAAGPNGIPQQERGRFDRGMQRGQQGALPTPRQPGVAPVANAPMPPQGRGRDRNEPPPLAHAPVPVPAAVPRDQQNGPDGHRRGTRPEQGGPQAVPGQQRMDQQSAAAQQQAGAQLQQRNQQQAADQQRHQQQEAQQRQRQQQQAAEQQHNQQQEARQRQQQQAAEQQRQQQQAAAAQQRAQQQQAAEQQRSQQQAAAQQQRAQQQAAAEQRRAERAQRHEPPAPQAAAPAPAAAQPASAPPQGHANEGKKEERRHRDRPEQN